MPNTLRLSFLLVGLGAALSAHAAPVLNDNFDTGYAVKSIDGQNGYDAHTDNDLSALVDATAGVGGSYGVTSDTSLAPTASTNYVYRPLNYRTTAASPILTASVDVASLGVPAGAAHNTGSAFGLSVFNGSGFSLGQILFRFAVGATTPAVFYMGANATAYTQYDAPGGVNAFQSVGIRFDTVKNVQTFLLNGAAIGTATYTRSDTTIGDVDLTTRVGGYDVGVFDNLKLEASAAPVPEPSAFAALGVGAFGFLRRRRR